VTYIIAEPCVDLLDKACIEECPVDPVEAIFYEDDVPEQWKSYTAANYEFFEDLGSPGGASKLGKVNKDAAFVAAQPPRETEH
jgi:hypothetical protein